MITIATVQQTSDYGDIHGHIVYFNTNKTLKNVNIMKKYEFSKHSYDKLKQFLEVVENNVTDTQNSIETNKILKQMFPENVELLKALKQHRCTRNDVIEIQDDSEDSNIQNTDSLTDADDVANTGNPTYTKHNNSSSSNSNHQALLENVVFSLKEMLDLKVDNTTTDMITILTQHEQNLDYIFHHLKNHSNVFNLGKSIANFSNISLIQGYCDIILRYHILSGTDGVELILQDFIEKHPQISCDSLVKCLLMISDEDKVTREFTDALLLLSDENKINILRNFVTQCSQLNLTKLKIVNNFLHNKMDLLVTKNLLDILSKNAVTLCADRNYALLLENLMLKSSSNLFPLKEHMKNVLNLVPGILKLKLLKKLSTLEQKGSEHSFSQTMHF